MKNTKKGFTLVELLVVIAILAILATVSVVGYTSFVERADKSAADQEIHQIKTIVDNALILEDEAYIDLGSSTVVKITKTASGVTVSKETTVPSDKLDLTGDIGAELVKKLSFTANALQYKYKTSSDPKILYGPGTSESGS